MWVTLTIGKIKYYTGHLFKCLTKYLLNNWPNVKHQHTTVLTLSGYNCVRDPPKICCVHCDYWAVQYL